MRKLVFATGLLLSCSDEPGDVCSQLAAAPSCGGDTKQLCNQAIATAKADPPMCAPHVDALAECIADLELSCSSSSSIAANGDGVVGGGQNFTMIGDYSVVVNDSACDVHRRGLEACRTCPDAAGATEVDVLGIGDRCVPGEACASGLSCQGGICTRACSSDDECHARADGCALQYQYPNTCGPDGMCTRSCGEDYSCQAWIGEASTCQDSACTRP